MKRRRGRGEGEHDEEDDDREKKGGNLMRRRKINLRDGLHLLLLSVGAGPVQHLEEV